MMTMNIERNIFFLPIFLFFFFLAFQLSICQSGPNALRISCGAENDIHTSPSDTLWSKDFAYTGGKTANGTRPSFITPPLNTVRYFPLSEGPENCYNIKNIPKGRYSIRVFFGLVSDPNFDNEAIFDVSIGGTLVYSLKQGWSNHDDEQAFVEALVHLTDGSVSICFHTTGHGDPTILSIELLQVDDKAYSLSEGTILRTHKRIDYGADKPKFDVDYSGDPWGGDRFWNQISTFGDISDRVISTTNIIKEASKLPNFYPDPIYQTAIESTENQPDLMFVMDVDPNRNYSIWLHFAEINSSITGAGQRVFDIVINGNIAFQDVDVVGMSNNIFTALVLNRTVPIDGRTLTISMVPSKGYAMISAIEIFEVIVIEPKTSSSEVEALQVLKSALGLPLRLGWNGDPCSPQQHPWVGLDCQFDRNSSKWVIDGIGLDNQGLSGFIPNEISNLSRLQSINLSGNSIQGQMPFSMGSLISLKIMDLSFNSINGSIPESLGQLASIQILNLNGNSLTGRVPEELGGRLLHRARFNFTDNAGLCGIPGLPTCGPHLSAGAKFGIAFVSLVILLLAISALVIWWKRKQNILRAQQMAARSSSYAKRKTHFSHELHLARHHGNGHARLALENGPSLLS